MGKPHRATGNPRGRPSKLPLDFENQILEALRRRVNPKTGLAWPDWKGIAREIGVSRSTIARKMVGIRAGGDVESVLVHTGPRTAVIYYRLSRKEERGAAPVESEMDEKTKNSFHPQGLK